MNLKKIICLNIVVGCSYIILNTLTSYFFLIKCVSESFDESIGIVLFLLLVMTVLLINLKNKNSKMIKRIVISIVTIVVSYIFTYLISWYL